MAVAQEVRAVSLGFFIFFGLFFVFFVMPMGGLALWEILRFYRTHLASKALLAWSAQRGFQSSSGPIPLSSVANGRIEGMSVQVGPAIPGKMSVQVGPVIPGNGVWLMVSAEMAQILPSELLLVNGATARDVRHIAKWEGPSSSYLSGDAAFDNRVLTIVEAPENVRIASDARARAEILSIPKKFGLFLKDRDLKLVFCEAFLPDDASVFEALDRAVNLVVTIGKAARAPQVAAAPPMTCPYCQQIFPSTELRCPNCQAAVKG